MRSRSIRIGAVLAGAVMLFVAGMVARGVADPGTDTSDQAAASTSSAPSVSDADQTHSEADVRVPTETGAVDTAIDLAVRPQSWLYLSDEEIETDVRKLSAPSSADQMVEEIVAEVSLVRDALAQSPGRIWWIVRPLAWRVDHFTTTRAQISVWTVSVLSASEVTMPQSDWMTTTLDLTWNGERWLLVATREVPGPTPQLGGRDGAWDPVPFDEALDDFHRVGREEL